jgi:GH24 family phage-related lysozyme (muramidase)
MNTSDACLQFIAQSEGLSTHVYDDNGKPAIGYGHDLQPGEEFSNGLMPEQAHELLVRDVTSRFEPTVNALVPPACTQGQFDACIDFAYNLGLGALRTMLSHGWSQVTTQIPLWCHVNGVKNDGLIARRNKEVEMFLS